jgi:hypothetical protein
MYLKRPEAAPGQPYCHFALAVHRNAAQIPPRNNRFHPSYTSLFQLQLLFLLVLLHAETFW